MQRRLPGRSVSLPRVGSLSGGRRWLLLAIAMLGGLGWLLYRERGAGPEVKRQLMPQGDLSSHPSARLRSPSEPPPLQAEAGDEARPITGSVVAASGHPVAGASVCMAPASDRCCAPTACTTADRSGRFILDSYPGGTGQLLASADGYLPLSRSVSEATRGSPLVLVLQAGGARLRGSIIDASGGPVVNAFVSAGPEGSSPSAVGWTDASGNFSLSVPAGGSQILARADGYSQVQRYIHAPQDDVRLVMVAASSLSGRVLTEETEEPLAGIDVIVLDPKGIGGELRRVSTDPAGAFQIDALPAGGYSILALSEHWRSDERWLTLGVAEQPSLELLVRPASHLHAIAEVAGSRCRSGRVVLAGPVSEYRVLDEKGEVDFRGIPPGSYRAVVNCVGALELTEQMQLAPQPAVHTWQLSRGLTLSGRALSPTGAPLEAVQVSVSPIELPGGRSTSFCTSDAQGEFSCSGLVPGDYECQLRNDSAEMSDPVRVTIGAESSPRVTLHSYASATLRVRIEAEGELQLGAISVVAQRKGGDWLSARQEGDAFVFEQLRLGSYEVASDPEVPGAKLHVQLVRGGEVVDVTLAGLAARTLEGRVVDEEGNGVPDAWVRVFGGVTNGPVKPVPPVLTDAEGAFTVEGLLAGRYLVDVSSSRGEGRLYDVAAGGTVTVPVHTFGSLSGTVSTAGGEPASTFSVAYGRSGTAAVERVSGGNGSWSLPWLAPGTYELDVQGAEGTARATVDIAPGRNATVALTLAAADSREAREPSAEP